jgi:hypothetical protein
MRKLLVFLIFSFGFGQIYPVRISDKALDPANQGAEFSNGVNWEYEVVDSAACPNFNSLTVDNSDIPHVIYDSLYTRSVDYVYRNDTTWHTERVDSAGRCYGFSIICDNDNIPHLSYYKGYGALDTIYLCYAQCDSIGWQISIVDTIIGYLHNVSFGLPSSIDLDMSGLPGIGYIAWNVEDSLYYVKYAHQICSFQWYNLGHISS